MTDSVTVIIPTLGTRPDELDRAIVSVTSQSGVDVVPLVVVNGRRSDQELIAKLERAPGIRCHQLETAGVSNARLQGRRLVETPYFAFLDDDDEFLPEALSLRLASLAETGADAVVTNGYRQIDGRREIIFPAFDHHRSDPARALLEENWLASAGGLYRTDKVGDALFMDLPDYLEMTYLAFLLAHRHKVVRLNRPTFVIHAGAADQASESWAYWKEIPKVLERMEAVTSRTDLLRHLKRRRAAALHHASVKALGHRNMSAAWAYHLHSLTIGNGLKYLPYTRHIVLGQDRP